LRSDDASELRQWLMRKTDFTSWLVQNEILEMISHSILRKIIQNIQDAGQFAVIVDGTQDTSGLEQESICIRYVDRNTLIPNEPFLGMYEMSTTTGHRLAAMVEDVLRHLNINIKNLRGQTYDGASNMAGIYNGCQAIILQKQPLALFVHCGAHCVNLVAQTASAASTCVQDAMQWVQEIGNFYGASIKYRQNFREIAITNSGSPARIKPLCPTRWLMRTASIDSVVENYAAVIQSLEEARSVNSGSSAIGLLDEFQKGATLLGLHMALAVFRPIEQLCKSLQSSTRSVSGMLQAVDIVKRELNRMRTMEYVTNMLSEVKCTVDELVKSR